MPNSSILALQWYVRKMELFGLLIYLYFFFPNVGNAFCLLFFFSC